MKVTHDVRNKGVHYLNLQDGSRTMSVLTENGTAAELTAHIREELAEIDRKHKRVTFMLQGLGAMTFPHVSTAVSPTLEGVKKELIEVLRLIVGNAEPAGDGIMVVCTLDIEAAERLLRSIDEAEE